MDINPVEYEKQVKEIAHDALLRLGLSPENVCVGFKNRIDGSSGFGHQLDISMEYFLKGKRILRIYECKLKSKEKVGIDEVMVLYSRITDIQTFYGDKVDVIGNFVTTIGYTQPAHNFAIYYGIEANYAQYNNASWGLSFDGNASLKPNSSYQKNISRSPDVTFFP